VGTILHGAVGGLGERFQTFRPHIHGLATNWPTPATVTQTGALWKIELGAGFGNAYKLMELKTAFFNWTSNRKTFDHIFENFYVVIPPGGPIAAEGFTLRFLTPPGTTRLYLAMDVGFWPDWYYFDLPPSPTGYWLPPQ
jgi:hypothetical protein